MIPGKDILSLLAMLATLVLLLAVCYFVTRWAGTGFSGRAGAPGGQRRMRVVERLNVGRDQALLVVQLAGRTFFIGSSSSGFSLLAELTEEEGALWAGPPPDHPSTGGDALDFRAMLRKLREKK